MTKETQAVYERLAANVQELLRNAEYADGNATVLTHDCEALEDCLEALRATPKMQGLWLAATQRSSDNAREE